MPATKPSLGRTILTFLIAGPPAGTVAFIGYMAGMELIKSGNLVAMSSLFNIVPFALVVGYILGAVPAMVTSLFVGWVIRRVDAAAQWVAASPVIGALASCLALFWILLGPNGGESKWVVVGAFAFTGAFAALVSTLVLLLLTPRPKAA